MFMVSLTYLLDDYVLVSYLMLVGFVHPSSPMSPSARPYTSKSVIQHQGLHHITYPYLLIPSTPPRADATYRHWASGGAVSCVSFVRVTLDVDVDVPSSLLPTPSPPHPCTRAAPASIPLRKHQPSKSQRRCNVSKALGGSNRFARLRAEIGSSNAFW